MARGYTVETERPRSRGPIVVSVPAGEQVLFMSVESTLPAATVLPTPKVIKLEPKSTSLKEQCFQDLQTFIEAHAAAIASLRSHGVKEGTDDLFLDTGPKLEILVHELIGSQVTEEEFIEKVTGVLRNKIPEDKMGNRANARDVAWVFYDYLEELKESFDFPPTIKGN